MCTPFLFTHPAGHPLSGNALRPEPFGQILAVPHVDAERYCLTAQDMVLVSLDDQPVARRDENRLLDVAPVVLDLVESNPAEVNIRPHTDTTDGDRLAPLDGLLEREPMRRVAEHLQ